MSPSVLANVRNISLVGSARFVLGDSFLQQDRDFRSRIHHGPLDLQLSTGNSYNNDILDDEEVNLSLSIGRSTYKRSRISTKSWNNKLLYPSIGLEESNEDAQPVFSLGQLFRKSTDHSTPYSSCFLMNNGNFHQDHMKIDQSYRKRESSKNSGVHQEWSSINQGAKACQDLKTTILVDLDLNKSLPDDSTFPSNEPLRESCSQIDNPSEASISSISTSKHPESRTCTKVDQTKAFTIDLESLPEPSSYLIDENDIHLSKVREQKGNQDFDGTVRKAALSLVSISLQQTRAGLHEDLRILGDVPKQTPPNYQDSETKSESNEIENSDERKKKTIPRSSSIDSYESLVLKLEENEDSATSNAFEMNESGQKGTGIKLRRGSRLKDFQKDILPIISSLSRHEILEDISILEGVIRSREYKRLNKAKTVKGELNGFKPARSKRSRVSYVGRTGCLRR